MNIQIQTTSNCSGRCKICAYQGSWHDKNPGKMSDETYDKVISEISSLCINKLCLYLQNEPFLDVKMFGRIEKLIEMRDTSEINYNLIELSTNLSALDKDKIDKLASILSRTTHELWISFHGVDQNTYEDIMGLNFQKAKDNLLFVLDAMQRHPLNVVVRGSGEPKIRTKDTPVWFGKAQYESFLKNVFYGYSRVPRIDYFQYHDRAGNSQIKLKHEPSSCRGRYCPRPNEWLHFLWNGGMVLCCMDYHRETVFGNIRDGIDLVKSGNKFNDLKRKCFGQIEAEDNFICKRCVSPGG